VLTLDLGRTQTICGLVMSMGASAVLYPGALSIATSVDNLAWEAGFAGNLGGSAFRAALEDPRDARITISLRERVARFVRLRIEQTQRSYVWAVAGLELKGGATTQAVVGHSTGASP
jgi:hypothetical protein